MGTPTDESWPEFSSLPSSGTFKWKSRDSNELDKKFQINSFSSTGQTYLDPNGFDLLRKLLTLNPKNRITADDALKHAYFNDGVKMQVPNFFD
jgi:cell division cycle 2-like protein